MDVARVNKVQSNQTSQEMKLAEWNVRTMLDRTEACRPERRSAIIANELRKYSIDVAALSEVRFPGCGSIREEAAGYTIFWSGKPPTEPKQAGVAIAISNIIVSQMDEEPKAVNDRIISLRLPLKHKRHCTIISVYAPTMTNPPEIIDRFYDELSQVLKDIPNADKIILLGDFNARVGSDQHIWPKVLGKFNSGRVNSNGEILLALCSEHQLAITNTYFNHRPSHKNSWMHPRSKQWHLIDFVITRQRDIQDFHNTRAMRGANCSTDHIMIVSKVNLIIRKRIAKRSSKKLKLDVNKMKLQSVKTELKEALAEKLEECDQMLDKPVEEQWDKFKKILYETSKEKLGPTKRKHEDWFDDNDTELLELIKTRNEARSEMMNRTTRSTTAKYKQTHKALQQRCRELKNQWWTDKAAELQELADFNDTKGFYQSMRAIWGPRVNHPSQLLDHGGQNVLSEKPDLLHRWTEHFNQLLNEETTVASVTTNSITQAPPQAWMDEAPEIEEVRKAVGMLSDGKSPGADGIHPEIIKSGGERVLQALTNIIKKAWKENEVPQDWKDAQLVTIFKKGDRRICGNYRGISLLSIPGKVFARVLLNRLSSQIDQFLPEAQCGFRAGRGTVDMVFSLKQVQEKCIEQNMPLYMVFVDFTKAFDTVNRTALWKLLQRYGCPEKFTTLIKALHENMQARVSLNGELSDPFTVSNGVKQGCVLAPTLFSLFLTATLTHAFNDCNKGVLIQSRPNADLFNVNQFKSTRKTKGILVRELMFADDTAFIAHSFDDAQEIVTRFSDAAKAFGLKINIKKTEMMYQPVPGSNTEGLNIRIDNQDLNRVSHFKYLGSTVSDTNKLDEELKSRMSKASSAFGRLRERVWDNKHLTIKTKAAVYRAIVLSTLLYGVESWTIYRITSHRLSAYMMRHLRYILKIRWWHHVSNKTILQQTGLPSMYDILRQRTLRWTGHVCRLNDNRLPKQILFSQLKEGSRSRGRPKLRYKGTVKRSLKDLDIPTNGWQTLTRNRASWRKLIHKQKSSSDSMDCQ